jgi:hypothetical protein
MKISRSVIIILLALLLLWLFTLLPGAAAAELSTPSHHDATRAGGGQITSTLMLTPNPVDVANAEAEHWQAVADQAVQSAQISINQAYGALANAQAGLNAAQAAVQQEHAARIAAEQGQIQQASQAAQQALIAANQSASAATSANDAARSSMQQALLALADVRSLKTELRQRDATIAGLTAASTTQQARIVELEQYSWTTYRSQLVAWMIVGLLGFVLIAGGCALVIIFATERRNRWPKFRNSIGGAVVVPFNDAQ